MRTAFANRGIQEVRRWIRQAAQPRTHHTNTLTQPRRSAADRKGKRRAMSVGSVIKLDALNSFQSYVQSEKLSSYQRKNMRYFLQCNFTQDMILTLFVVLECHLCNQWLNHSYEKVCIIHSETVFICTDPKYCSGESINDISSSNKQEIYHEHSSIVGFKIDMRFLYDTDEHEWCERWLVWMGLSRWRVEKRLCQGIRSRYPSPRWRVTTWYRSSLPFSLFFLSLIPNHKMLIQNKYAHLAQIWPI